MKRLCLAVALLAAFACQKPTVAAVASDAADATATGPATVPTTPREVPRPGSPPDRSCRTAADCEAVGCECGCSGGVSLREDAVNRADAERWYKERGCSKPTKCDPVICPPSRLDCVGGACHVVFGETGAGGAGP